jgi:hypothetical protein
VADDDAAEVDALLSEDRLLRLILGTLSCPRNKKEQEEE